MMMMKRESNEVGGEEHNRARACDTCQSNACTVYCHADSAYLCTSCDAEVHSANRVASRHKRVPVCESCERAPAAFLCEADDASLCTTCDAEVHSANPLARRHQRLPILPITGNSCNSKATHHKSETAITDPEKNRRVEEDAKDAPSLLFSNSDKNSGNHQDKGLLFTDDYLDFADYNSTMDYKFTVQYNQHQQDCNVPQTSYGGDRVVPLQLEESRGHLSHKEQNFQSCNSSGSHYRVSYNNHNAYISSLETSVVPEPTPNQQPDPPTQMMDREARVLRYKEKKKTRKFEKTIRYASRKAYAERRPRINGRFAKRTEIEAEDDQRFSTMLMYDTGYGIVPSF